MEKEMLKEFVDWARNCGEDESYIFEETQEAIERFLFEKDLKSFKSEYAEVRNTEQNIPKSGNNRSEKLKGCACYGSNSLHPCFCGNHLKDKSE